jgi:periplasmic divalent cation tolerance protein
MSESAEGIVQVVTTIDSQNAANDLVKEIVGQRLAACGQVIGPVQSTYWWDGQLESAEEWMCILKTTIEHLPDLQTHLHQVHPYDVPELLAVPVADGSSAYIDWMRGELRPLSSR